MSITDPLIGHKLGDYVIQGILGTGGMARVYRGYDDQLDRFAAVKVTEPHLIASADEEEYRERFLREARAIARLNHPQIVRIYQFGQLDNLYYIAMEYVQGRNLREVMKRYIRQGRFIPRVDVLRVLNDIGSALDYAHSQSIIHRDVKPSNIIVRDDGNSVLTDFGLALNAAEGTIGNTFGSVHYIAPEQAISSAQATAQSDQYSLAIVCYEMLTGQVPFDDASAMSVALKHISDPPPPPSELNPAITLSVERVLLRALDKDFQKRFSSCVEFTQELANAFDSAEDDRPTSPTSPFAPGVLPKVMPQRDTASAPRETRPTRAQHALPQATPIEDEDAPTIMDTSSRPILVEELLDLEQRASEQDPPTKPQADAPTGKRRQGVLVAAVVGLVVVIGVIAALFLGAGFGNNDPAATETAAQAIAAAIERTETQSAQQTLIADARVLQTERAASTAAARETDMAATAAAASPTPGRPADTSATEIALLLTTPAPTTPASRPGNASAVANLPNQQAAVGDTDTPTATSTPTETATPTATASPTPTATATASPTPTASATASPTPTASATASPTPTASATASPTPTATATASPTPTATDAASPTPTASATASPTPTATATASPTPTASATASPTPTATDTPAPAASATPQASLTPGLVLSEADTAPLLLRYDGRTLVIYNRAEARATVNNLRFYLLEPDPDKPDGFIETEVFAAREWGDLNRGLASGRCLQVWSLRYRFLPLTEPPADICLSRVFFRQTADPFWFSELYDEGAYFEVRRGTVDVLAECPAAEPDSLDETRCVVPPEQ